VRTFTLEEARELLPRVRSVAEQIVEHKRRLDEAESSRDALRARIAANGGDITPSESAEAEQGVTREAETIAALVDELQDLGVLVKDLDLGLVDFPTLRDGEIVLLCWHAGEEEIGYWHGIEEGYAGRKPI
jgi:hypothetical protein